MVYLRSSQAGTLTGFAIWLAYAPSVSTQNVDVPAVVEQVHKASRFGPLKRPGTVLGGITFPSKCPQHIHKHSWFPVHLHGIKKCLHLVRVHLKTVIDKLDMLCKN